MPRGDRNPEAQRSLVYLELVAPRPDRPESRSKWLYWLNRDFPWALSEGWSVEIWGLRDWHNRTRSSGQLRVRGLRIPFARVPWIFLVTWAWAVQLFLTLSTHQ